MSLGLYVHIPFCARKCIYCDFLSFPAGEEIREAYCRSLMEEIRSTAVFLNAASGDSNAAAGDNASVSDNSDTGLGNPCAASGDACTASGNLCVDFNNPARDPVTSIYIGGGTPSILTPRQIEEIMACIRDSFPIDERAEISMEANPGSLNEEKLAAARAAGINRLSMGLQSTEDQLLKKLGRIHSYSDFQGNYDLARRMGFDNINIDIMTALPGQTREDYARTLQKVMDLKPEHISAYSLIIEESTPLAANRSLLDQLPGEEEDRQMYEMTREILLSGGYHRYEISNYALAGRECRHNISYWDGTPYLGLGLNASSYYKHARFSNESDLKKYIDQPFVTFEDRADYQIQTPEEEMEDFMIFGLRMMRGVSYKTFAERFAKDLDQIYGSVIDRYAALGLLVREDGRVRLTGPGIDVSNRIFMDFLM